MGCSFAFVPSQGVRLHSSRSNDIFSASPTRHIRLIRVASQRRVRHPNRPAVHMTTTETDSKKPYFDTSVVPGESLFSAYTHPTPPSSEELALSKGIPLDDLSTSYGHILASTIDDDIPISLNTDLLTSTLLSSLHSSPDRSSKPDTTSLSRLITRACDPTDTLDQPAIDHLSSLYALMLAQSLHLSGLGLRPHALVDGLKARLENRTHPFPMPREEYDTNFATLQDCATRLSGTASVDAADTFFSSLKTHPSIHDVQKDGYILSVTSNSNDDNTSPSRVTQPDDVVNVAARARLLDGRLVLSAAPHGEGDGVLNLSIEKLPHAFAAVLTDLAVGQWRSVFYHPYAACEILPLFLDPEHIPPQAGLLVDLHLLGIQDTSASS